MTDPCTCPGDEAGGHSWNCKRLGEPPPCGYMLLWWDGDNEGAYVCTLPAGHLTLHTDGKVTFDNDDLIECGCPSYCPLHPELLPFGGAR